MITLLILAFLVAMYFIGLGVIVAFVKETVHQAKIARTARKEQKRIVKQNKGNGNKAQKTKLTKEERMKIKHEANKVAYENNPKTIARKRFKEEFGHEFLAKGTGGYREGQRYQEIKREVKAELKAKKKETKNK